MGNQSVVAYCFELEDYTENGAETATYLARSVCGNYGRLVGNPVATLPRAPIFPLGGVTKSMVPRLPAMLRNRR
jgi:hypothetical protein